jgi:hypothetical protein
MNNQLAPTTLLDDLHPSRYIKPADLIDRWHVQQVTVTISRMTNEDTIPNPRDIDPDTHQPRVVVQPVLYFATRDGREFPRGYLLSAATDVQSLKSSTGAHTVGELTGKRIIIALAEWKHKSVLRIDPKPVTG